MKVLKATYGTDDCGIDVTERLQGLVHEGRLNVIVSNRLFTDPCPNEVKTLRYLYELPSSPQFYLSETEEHKHAIAPLVGGDCVAILYTNNSVPPKYLERVLKQLEKAADGIDVLTCPWHPIEGNPFPEIAWAHHVSSYLTIALQILKLLYTAQEVGNYEYVFFLEHDVLYPEGYFDIQPFTQDVLSTTNYMGLSEQGFLPDHAGIQPLHLLAMRMPAAVEHFTMNIRGALIDPNFVNEPYGRTWAKRQSSEPAVHINHGNHFSPYSTYFSREKIEKTHSYWGSAASWWE